VKGRRLFLGLVQHYSRAGFRICYFKYDCPVSTDQLEMNQININPFQMNSNDDTTVWLQHAKGQTSSKGQGETMIVAVDSLTPLLLKSSTAIILAAIKNFAQTGRFIEIPSCEPNEILMFPLQKTVIS